jgi:hypothetical protein
MLVLPDDDPIIDHHRFDLKYRLGDLRGSSVPGATLLRLTDSPILVVAAHSVAHVRAARPKRAEFWTGAVAESLGSLLGASVLTALSPRYEATTAASPDEFLAVLRMVLASRPVRLVFDIHGLGARHAMDINVGSAGFPDRTLVARLAEALAKDFSVSVDTPYGGRTGITAMVNHDSDLPASAIQLELNTRLRSDTTAPADLLALADVLRSVTEDFVNGC